MLGQARGAALVALGEAGLTVHEYAATQIKQAVTGSGRAAKEQIQRMVRTLLSLESKPAADAADALAAAICHAHMGRLAGLGVTPRRRPRARGGPRIGARARAEKRKGCWARAAGPRAQHPQCPKSTDA